MTTLELFLGKAGDRVTLKTQPDNNISSYVVFVQQWLPDGGKKPIATWFPNELESAAGASFDLTANSQGYDMILKAQVTNDATIQAEVDFNGTSSFSKGVALPKVEGPVVACEWSIVMVTV